MRNRAYNGTSVLLVAMFLAASGCAFGSGTGTASGRWRADEPAGAVQLNVTNHSGGPMTIYVAGGGTSYRIGTVFPGLSEHFVVRPVMIVNGPVEFVARSSNREPTYRSGRFLLAPGNVVDFELASTPTSSVATVRP
jgi:hypothetical protein